MATGTADSVHLLPKIIESLDNTYIEDIVMGDNHCLALTRRKSNPEYSIIQWLLRLGDFTANWMIDLFRFNDFVSAWRSFSDSATIRGK